MPAIIVLIITLLVGLITLLRGINEYIAWILSCCIMRAFILSTEFVLPYMGGGASMRPIALAVGSFVALLSAAGVL